VAGADAAEAAVGFADESDRMANYYAGQAASIIGNALDSRELGENSYVAQH
jgi:hypothetical protein